MASNEVHEVGTALLLAAAPAGRGRAVDAASVLPALAAVPPGALTGTKTATVVELADPLDPQTVLTRLRTAAMSPGPLAVYLAGQLHLDRRQHLPHLALARTTATTLRYTGLPWHWLAGELAARRPGTTTVVVDLVAEADLWRRLRDTPGLLGIGSGPLLYGRVVPAPRRGGPVTPEYLRAFATIWRTGARPSLATLHEEAAARTAEPDVLLLTPGGPPARPPASAPGPLPAAAPGRVAGVPDPGRPPLTAGVTSPAGNGPADGGTGRPRAASASPHGSFTLLEAPPTAILRSAPRTPRHGTGPACPPDTGRPAPGEPAGTAAAPGSAQGAAPLTALRVPRSGRPSGAAPEAGPMESDGAPGPVEAADGSAGDGSGARGPGTPVAAAEPTPVPRPPTPPVPSGPVTSAPGGSTARPPSPPVSVPVPPAPSAPPRPPYPVSASPGTDSPAVPMSPAGPAGRRADISGRPAGPPGPPTTGARPAVARQPAAPAAYDPHPAILAAAQAGRHGEAVAVAAAWEQEALRRCGARSQEAVHWMEVRADLARLAGDPARSCELWITAARARLELRQGPEDPDVEGAVDRAHHQWEQIEDMLRAREAAPALVELRELVPGRKAGALAAIRRRLR
ncbi:hypothetical protein OG393_31345 [Streptomyces sp. NBC_01216]|uniref:hypothetical protein n=1 Tax=Streptomyces sp. NBC_01216 TaxID=2903778 RepID=UPI002E115E21|nr:hypothetical protein OG393_31345 [Streptomyces sp. NBC_01216]